MRKPLESLTDREINRLIAKRIFGWEEDAAWSFTMGELRGGRLCVATKHLMVRLKQLGVKCTVDPKCGRAFCIEGLKELFILPN